MSIEQLGEQIAAMAADIEAAMCRWLGLVAEFDRREGWATEGCTSCAAWVSWRCGIGPQAAREHVRVARRLGELPAVRDAFSRGELSFSKVRAITRVEEVQHEGDLVDLASNATAAQLERIVRSYRSAVAAESDAARVLDERFLALEWDEDGSLRVRGRLPADQGALLVKAVEIAAEQLRADAAAEGGATGEGGAGGPAAAPTPAAARRADALGVLADQALAASEHGRTGGDRVQIVVRVDDAALASDAAGLCELDGGPALARSTARRLACDASVVRIRERDGEPLSVGCKTRSIPPALRRALRARDGGCRFPGCTNHRFVDAHHIHHWADGGPTDLRNLVHLCTHHHRLLHEGGFTVRPAAAPGGFEFRTPAGQLLRDVPRPSRRGSQGCEAPAGRVSAETRIQVRCDPLDLGLATGAMLRVAPPPVRPSCNEPPGAVLAT